MERTPLYLDFEAGEIKELSNDDTLSPVNLQSILPVNYVVMNTTNTDPADDLGFGDWTYLGSAVIGATTVYYYQNTAL